jgi:hypothetical protein
VSSNAEYQRKYRASKGARTGVPGRPAVQPCGTYAAYKRHLRKGEAPCNLCKQANAARSKARRS